MDVLPYLECGCLERRLTDEKGVHDAAEGPDVGREAVAFLVQDLGADVVGGTADSSDK